MVPGARSRVALAAAALALLGVVATVVPGVAPSVAASAASTTTPVMQPSRLTAVDLAGWYRSTGKVSQATVGIDELAADFVQEGADEGVAGDLAFAQAMVETGYLAFGGQVPAANNNFSGLGALDGGVGGASFPDARTGVRAQVQHLRAYADATVTVAKLAHPVVDPRFDLVSPKGKAPNWEQFGSGIWATNTTYADKVLGMYAAIVRWAAAHPAFPPFASAASLVAAAYRDLLFRPPTAAEAAAATGGLEAGSETPAGLLARLVAEDGPRDVHPVTRLYRAAFGRLPDRNGLSYWSRRHAAGTTLIHIAEPFVASSEFVRRYGALTDAAFVDLVYRNVLGRPADPAGADYWVRRLAARRVTRAGILVQFAQSSELIRTSAASVEASHLYLGLLLRRPTGDEVAWWSARRAAGDPLATLAATVFADPTYVARYA